jgi:hypothetical protein
VVKSRIQVGPRIACLAAILSSFSLLLVRVQALNILLPPKPYLVLRDTLCSCEAYGMRPMYKEKKTLRVRPVGAVSERWRSSGSESGRFDWSKSICVVGRW